MKLAQMLMMRTKTTNYIDWYLPSKNELAGMRTNLMVAGVGDFLGSAYWSSSEVDANNAWVQVRATGTQISYPKNIDTVNVRASRTFTIIEGSPSYALRNKGQANGWIYLVVNNLDGSYTYYECSPSDQPQSAWSNVLSLVSGTSINVGQGYNNTDLIIAQIGHTNSAAKICKDLTI